MRLLLALTLVSVLLVGPAQGARTGPAHMLIGYYVGYERDQMPPSEIEWDALTHVAVGVVAPVPNGTLDLAFDLPAGEGVPFAQDLSQRAHAHGVVPILMIGGADTSDLFRAAVKKHKKAFVANLVSALSQLGYDGLDIDWEPLEKRDESPFRALITALRKALPNAVLTAPAQWTTLTFPKPSKVWKRVAPLLDRIDLMTYNMEGTDEGWQSWHSSALDGATPSTPSSVSVSVASYLAAGIPAAKLGVGIGFFGDCWTAPVTGPGQDFGDATILSDNDMTTRMIMEDYYSPGAAHVDPNAHVPYLSFGAPTGPAGCTYISYENAASIAAKGAWALGQGLGGAIVWTINQGHDETAPPGQRDALLRSAKTAFGA